MGIPVDMVPPRTEHNNDKNKNNEDREEGEIVDDFEDIISSDEEFSMRERIKELEARNLELEKIASISGIYSYDVGYSKERYKSPISPSDLSKEDYYVSGSKAKHNRPTTKASGKQPTAAVKRSKSSTRQHVKSGRRRSVSPPPETMPLVSSRTRTRKRKYQKISRSRSSKRTAKSKKKTDLIDISSSEDEICALNRDELKKALKRDVKTFHHTKKNLKNTTMQKSLICDNIVSVIDLVDEDDDNKDELSDDSVTLEEQELRLIALKSAVFKKHLDRKKKKEKEELKPYSPSEFVELFGTFRGSPSSKNSVESGPMDISPITSPEYLTDNNNKPIDMDLVNSSDSECPIFAGQTDSWIPIDQIPLPNSNQKIPLQSPIPIKVTLAEGPNHIAKNYENDERVEIITVSNSPEPEDEEELALRALLLAKMNSPKVSKNSNKPKDDYTAESTNNSRNEYLKIDGPMINDSDTSLNAEILRNILLISLDKKPISKTEQVLKEAVKRLQNQTQNKNGSFVSEGSDVQENSNSNDFNNPFPADMDYRMQNNSTNCSVEQGPDMKSDNSSVGAKEIHRNDKSKTNDSIEKLSLKSSNIKIENNNTIQSQIDQLGSVTPQEIDLFTEALEQPENTSINQEEDVNAQNENNVNIQLIQKASSVDQTKINDNDSYRGECSNLQENSYSNGFDNSFPSDVDYRIQNNSTNCSVVQGQDMKNDITSLRTKEIHRNDKNKLDDSVKKLSLKSSNINIENDNTGTNKLIQSQINQVGSVTTQEIDLFTQELEQPENTSINQEEEVNAQNQNNINIQILQTASSGNVKNQTRINENDLHGGEDANLQENSNSNGFDNPSDVDCRMQNNSTNCSVEQSEITRSDKVLLDTKEIIRNDKNKSDNFVEQLPLDSSSYDVKNNKETKLVQSEIDQVESVILQKIDLFTQESIDQLENIPIIQEDLNIQNKNNSNIQTLQVGGPSGNLVPNNTLVDIKTIQGKNNFNTRASRLLPANISKTNKILAKSKIIKSTTKYASKSLHHISQQKRKALIKAHTGSTLYENFKSISNSPEYVLNPKTSRLITMVDVPTVQKMVIHLGESESDTDDFESVFTNATASTTFEDCCDNRSSNNVTLVSPCASPQNALSPVTVVTIDDTTGDSEVIEELSSTKKCIVNDVFQARLNEFLKNARTKVEMIKKDPETTSLTPLAVRHLPPSSQLEYKRLVNRMKILEKQKEAKNYKITGDLDNLKVTIKNDVIKTKTDGAQTTNMKRAILNEGVQTSTINLTEVNLKDPLIKKVLIKNASNPQIAYNVDTKEISHSKENALIYATTSKDARLKGRSLSEGTQTKGSIQLQENTATMSTAPRLDKIDLLQNYETDFKINSASLLENISKTINLVHIAKDEKIKKFALQSKLERLKKQMESVEMQINNQTERILKIYPEISESHKVIVNLKQKCMKLDKLTVNFDKAVKGKTYKSNEDVKLAIAEKTKLLSDEIKCLKGLKLNNYIKLMNAENNMDSSKNSPHGVKSSEIAIEGCNINVCNCDETEEAVKSRSDIKCDKETEITDSANIGTMSCSKMDITEKSTSLNETSFSKISINTPMEIDIVEESKQLPLHDNANSEKFNEQNLICDSKIMEGDIKDYKQEIVPEALHHKTEINKSKECVVDISLQTEESDIEETIIGNTADIINIADKIGNKSDNAIDCMNEQHTLEALTLPKPCTDICISNSTKIPIDDRGNNSLEAVFNISALKIDEEIVISRDQSVYDESNSMFVEETLIDHKNISDGEKFTEFCKIKEYVSPLQYIRDSRLINPNGIICPYQLRGQCDDKDCKFEHLPNDDNNKT